MKYSTQSESSSHDQQGDDEDSSPSNVLPGGRLLELGLLRGFAPCGWLWARLKSAGAFIPRLRVRRLPQEGEWQGFTKPLGAAGRPRLSGHCLG